MLQNDSSSTSLKKPTSLSFSPVQIWPFPSYPALHEQVNDPTVLEQEAAASQLCLFAVHSSISSTTKNNNKNKTTTNHEVILCRAEGLNRNYIFVVVAKGLLRAKFDGMLF